jgi:hypothetical protein
MGLYRNIAGFQNSERVGLINFTNLQPGSVTNLIRDPIDTAAIDAAYYTEMQSRYDWLLSHSINEVLAAGYYVTLDNGSIFHWTDDGHTTSIAYLPLQDIQRIENDRGTAGTLLLHMNEPALAKDTAGYAGGSSSTFSGQPPTDSTPILQVQTLPPVSTDPTGTVFYDPGTVSPTTTTTTTPTASTPLPSDMATAIKNNLLPLAIIAGLVVVAVGGDDLLHRRSRVVFLGGVGALFFMMAKK